MRISSIVLVVILLSGAMFMCGCGDAVTEAPVEPVNADPKLDSADAVVAYFNQLCCDAEEVDLDAVLALYFAESALQARLIEISRANVPYNRLQHEVWLRFGEFMTEDMQLSPLAPNANRATIIERSDQRATAQYVDNDGDEVTLYLVEFIDQWWISGYTLEHDPTNDRIIDKLDEVERACSIGSPVALRLLERIQADEFSSVEEVREAWKEMLREQSGV